MNVISFKTIWKSYLDAVDLRDRGIGYVAAGGTNVAPSATGAGSLGVTVAASSGVGFIVNSATTFSTYAGGAITLTAANATNPRVDIVYFDSTGTLAKTDGTAAAIVLGVSGPVPPAWPAGSCPLAICLVPSTATDFTTGGYVMDVRCFRSLPTGTASSTTFWRGDNQWAAPVAASGRQVVSRTIVSQQVNNSLSSVGYVDLTGMTATVTTLTGDQVCVRIQGGWQKAVGGTMSIVVDRSGTKVGGDTTLSTVWYSGPPYSLFIPFIKEAWDAPAAGTYTYKGQGWNSDANTATFGGNLFMQFVCEVWR